MWVVTGSWFEAGGKFGPGSAGNSSSSDNSGMVERELSNLLLAA